ncbi:hypothetical protein PP637_gp82 [Arthrobacter phage Persistence]|uniref:MazG-like nucleotide pyrophosphohydrolase n=1 Tax=Arthrobacter phage Persistence TaxID=2836007 RepID=A0A8F3E492_9CAUD|nr:hypothetical protein PP637_gp82 [Arthrobacter phage Persistence]QWY79710.1 hypothetical protein SEA_PERSISTENCE_82 [Arthrobacter phage Persistence]
MTEQQNECKPWRVSVGQDEMPTIDTIVSQALGSASMCWDNISAAGAFDSEEAAHIAQGATDAIRRVLEIEAFHDAFGKQLAPELIEKWDGCSRAEAIRQCEENHKNLLNAYKAIDSLRAKLGVEDGPTGPQPGSLEDPWNGARDDDKLHLIRALVEGTTAFGSDMAAFKRRLELIINA